MIKTKQPEVSLYSYTQAPREAMGLAISAWLSDDFHTTPEAMAEEGTDKYCNKALKGFHSNALEYVNTVWVIKNVSRAFQQQLTRTRLAVYSIQSMRAVTKSGFAMSGSYTMPPNLTPYQQQSFHTTMILIQDQYEKLMYSGVKAEDARGVLPLNIHSDISMAITLSSLFATIKKRFCVLVQWEYRQVATQMKQIIKEEFGDDFVTSLDAPCIAAKKCPMREDYCGVPVWKMPEEERDEFYQNYNPID